MCLQTFMYWDCGHSDISDKTCKLAADQPFYIKFTCPNYCCVSQRFPFACGVGKYYCRTGQHGPFLDNVHREIESIGAELAGLYSRINRLKMSAASFIQFADRSGISTEERKRHPAYLNIDKAFGEMVEHRQQLNDASMKNKAIVKQAYEYHEKRKRYIMSGQDPSTFPAFVLPPSLQMTAAISMQTLTNNPGDTPGAAPSFGVRQHGLHEREQSADSRFETPATGTSDDIYVTPPKSTRFKDRSRDARRTVNEQPKEDEGSNRGRQPIASTTRLGRPRHVKEQEAPNSPVDLRTRDLKSQAKASVEKESPGIRRSGRVRKKINYAETEHSSSSRDTSPQKSDISSFSPTKSASASPSKDLRMRYLEAASSVRRAASSLSSTTSDWKIQQEIAAAGSLERARKGLKGGTSALSPASPSQAHLEGMEGSAQFALTQLQAQRASKRAELGSHMGGTSENSQEMRNETSTNIYPNTSTQLQKAAADYLIRERSQTPMSNLYNIYANREINVAHPRAGFVNAPSTTQPELNYSWLINTPVVSKETASSIHPPAEHNLAGSLPQTVSARSYDDMRRSFGKSAQLAPQPAATDIGSANKQPEKRGVSASSPLLPSKRTRLSSADKETTADTFFSNLPKSRNVAVSSPPTVLHRQTLRRAPVTTAESTVTLPASIPTPAGATVMRPRPDVVDQETAQQSIDQYGRQANRGGDGESSPKPETVSRDEITADATELVPEDPDAWEAESTDIPFAEIDWISLEDD